MKAVRIDGQTPGKTRSKLSENVPLDVPYLIQIFPVYACNFKCNYCIHSVSVSERKYISNKTFMTFETFKEVIDDLSEFHKKVKMLRFAGIGEPLLHKDIAKMVKYAHDKKVAESIDIVTNGLLLTEELSDALIDAQLSKLRISIQGINSEKYKKICGADIEFEKFVNKIKYFYDNSQNTKIYIKIIDSALENGDEEKFFSIFGDICDEIAIEHLLPAVSQIDYRAISNKDFILGQNGTDIPNIDVCPQPFYLMQINPEGNIFPCCSMEAACIMGNCHEESICDIWNGKKFNLFRKRQLSKKKELYPICKKCKQYIYNTFPEDILDNDAERLLKLF